MLRMLFKEVQESAVELRIRRSGRIDFGDLDVSETNKAIGATNTAHLSSSSSPM